MRSIAPILVALLVLSGCAAQAPGATPPAPDGGDFTLVIVDGEPGDAPGISGSGTGCCPTPGSGE